MIEETRDGFKLKSGRELYVNRGIFGIVREDDRISLYYGYDGTLDTYDGECDFTPDEKREIAEHNIKLWREYAGLLHEKQYSQDEK